MKEQKIDLEKVGRLLKEKKLKQKDVANALGICIMSANRKLNGTRDFRASELFGLANLLNVSANDLLKSAHDGI